MKKICLIVGEFHYDLAKQMVREAEKAAKKLNLNIAKIIWIPGSFEVPLAIQRSIKTKKYDAVAVLGYIEKGKTMHGEVIGHQVANKILDLQLKYNLPIGFGIIGPGATLKQAQARAKSSAYEAILAVSKMLKLNCN